MALNKMTLRLCCVCPTPSISEDHRSFMSWALPSWKYPRLYVPLPLDMYFPKTLFFSRSFPAMPRSLSWLEHRPYTKKLRVQSPVEVHRGGNQPMYLSLLLSHSHSPFLFLQHKFKKIYISLVLSFGPVFNL